MLDSWGCITEENYSSKVERTNKYKPLLLDMANFVQKALVKYRDQEDKDFKWFLNDGSLLGAFRTGSMIKHDYNFDFGIYYTKDRLVLLNDFLKKELQETNYECLIIQDYAYKIEIWDPTHGVHSKVAPRFFNVILDLQLFADDPENESQVKVQYFRVNNKDDGKYLKKWFQELKVIKFENYDYPCVSNVESFLKVTYGYIGDNALWDEESGKYVEKM